MRTEASACGYVIIAFYLLSLGSIAPYITRYLLADDLGAILIILTKNHLLWYAFTKFYPNVFTFNAYKKRKMHSVSKTFRWFTTYVAWSIETMWMAVTYFYIHVDETVCLRASPLETKRQRCHNNYSVNLNWNPVNCKICAFSAET